MKSLSLSRPHLLIMVGLPGSGKTFFANKFAETFRAPYVNQDKIRILAENSDIPTKLIAFYQLDELLKTQQSIIFEGATSTRAERMELAKKAKDSGYETLIVWVQTDPATAKTRALKEENGRNEERLDHLTKRFAAPSASEKYIVVSGKHTYASQARALLKRLSEPRAEIAAHTVAPIRLEASGRRNITIR